MNQALMEQKNTSMKIKIISDHIESVILFFCIFSRIIFVLINRVLTFSIKNRKNNFYYILVKHSDIR